MKEAMHKFVADSTTAFTAGSGAAVATGGKNEIIVLIVTLLAPVVKDGLIKLFDGLVKKLKSKKAK